jgi:hypothetical protein
MPASETAWVDLEDFKAQYPDYHVEDKLLVPREEMSCMESHLAGVLGARRAQVVRIRVC